MDFEPIDNTLDSNQTVQISNIIEKLTSLSLSNKLEFKIMEPIKVRGLKTWEGGIEFYINEEFNSLNFRVSFDADYPDRPTNYQVCGGGSFSDSLFLNISGYYGKELDNALIIFNKYLDCVNKKSVPKELLKPQDVWVDERIGIPRGFEKEIPILTAVGMKRLYHDFHLLEARRMFLSDFSYEVELIYNGRELSEYVTIRDSKIVRVNNYYSDRNKDSLSKALAIITSNPKKDSEGFIYSYIGDGIPKPVSKTYHQIKSLEEKLRILPDIWQKDLLAVYNGSGVF